MDGFDNIEVLAHQPESHCFERKSARKDVDEIAKHLMAFANASGGKLVVGIEDDGAVTGFKRDQAHAIECFEQVHMTALTPAPQVGIRRIAVVNDKGDDDQVLVMDVACAEGQVVRRRKDGKVALRQGGASVWLDYKQTRSLEYDQGEHYFESEVLLDTSIKDVDQDAVRAYRQALGATVGDGKLLRSIGALKGEHLTNAGVMLFGAQAGIALPQSRFRVLKIDGTEMGHGEKLRIIKDRTFDGPFVRAIPEARDFIASQLREYQFQERGTMEFKVVSEYPEYTWFEGLVNAVTHRDYSIRGEYIRVYIFDDRMLIQSPGSLPGAVTLENMRHQRFSRNPIIARVFSAFDWVRELNEGVDKIYQEMGEAGLPEPEYVSQDDYYLKLTLRNDVKSRIPRLGRDIPSLIPSPSEGISEGIRLNRSAVEVLRVIYANDKATTRDIGKQTGLSESSVYRAVKRLREEGIIRREGSKKKGRWKVRDLS